MESDDMGVSHFRMDLELSLELRDLISMSEPPNVR